MTFARLHKLSISRKCKEEEMICMWTNWKPLILGFTLLSTIMYPISLIKTIQTSYYRKEALQRHLITTRQVWTSSYKIQNINSRSFTMIKNLNGKRASPNSNSSSYKLRKLWSLINLAGLVDKPRQIGTSITIIIKGQGTREAYLGNQGAMVWLWELNHWWETLRIIIKEITTRMKEIIILTLMLYNSHSPCL